MSASEVESPSPSDVPKSDDLGDKNGGNSIISLVQSLRVECNAWANLSFYAAVRALAEMAPWMVSIVFIGHVGVAELAALSVVEVWVYSFMQVAWVGIGYTEGFLVAQAHGKKKLTVMRGWFVISLSIMLLCNIVIAILCCVTKPALDAFGFEPHTVRTGAIYAYYILPAVFIEGTNVCITTYLMSFQLAWPSTLIQIISLIIDFPLSYILIFGLHGRPNDYLDPMNNALVATGVAWGIVSFIALTLNLCTLYKIWGRELEYGHDDNENENKAIENASINVNINAIDKLPTVGRDSITTGKTATKPISILPPILEGDELASNATASVRDDRWTMHDEGFTVSTMHNSSFSLNQTPSTPGIPSEMILPAGRRSLTRPPSSTSELESNRESNVSFVEPNASTHGIHRSRSDTTNSISASRLSSLRDSVLNSSQRPVSVDRSSSSANFIDLIEMHLNSVFAASSARRRSEAGSARHSSVGHDSVFRGRARGVPFRMATTHLDECLEAEDDNEDYDFDDYYDDDDVDDRDNSMDIDSNNVQGKNRNQGSTSKNSIMKWSIGVMSKGDRATEENGKKKVKGKKGKGTGLKKFLSQKKRWITYCRQAVPNMSSIFVQSLSYFVLSFLAAKLGPLMIATHNANTALIEVLFTIIRGMGEATTFRVAFHIGNGNVAAAKRVTVIAFLLSGLFGASLSLLGYFLRNSFARLVSSDPQVIQASVELAPFLWLTYFIFGIGQQALAVLEGQGRGDGQAFSFFIGAWVITIPAAIISYLCTDFMLSGIWGSLLIGNAASCIIGLVLLYRSDWEKIALDASERISESSNAGRHTSVGIQSSARMSTSLSRVLPDGKMSSDMISARAAKFNEEL